MSALKCRLWGAIRMDSGTLIHARFEAQAAARPDALAISSEHGALTYGRLDALTRHHAARIDAAAPTGAVVAILAERGPHVVVATLACARAGRPFVILDRTYPAQRLGALIEICRPSLILAASADAPAERPHAEPPTLAVDLEPDELAAFEPRTVSPDAPAYLLFTSGSTGAPKCVACSHRPLTHFVAWQAATFALSADDRFTLLSGLSHDPVLRDIFTPLSLGASIHIPAQATLTAPGGVRHWFDEVRPTVAHMTPPLGHLLTAVRPPKPLRELRYVFWGGDVLRGPLVDALAAIAPACESVNFYGSTETPQAASFCRLPRAAAEARAPIGTGISGFELEIVDEHGRPASDGDPGEIVVRSRYLTLGYVENGRLPPPRNGEARYATGDIGHRRDDGQIEIQGRRDDQVKVRGYRVELAEINARALTAPGVAQVITLNVGGAEAVRLASFAQPAAGHALHCDTLRAHIADALPAYMVPDEIVVLEALPLLPNGKIDRQALIQRQTAPAAVASKPALASSPVEAKLIEEWRGFFRPDDVTPAASFASLGGDSLSYVNAYLSIEEVLGAVPDGWATMSLAELAATAKANAKRSPFVQVESAILMRALAISAVVASHFQLIFTGGAATSALIWVSGFIFGSLQLHEVDHRSDAGPIARLLKSLLIPLYLIELPQILAKLATHHAVQLSSLLLYVDLLDFTGAPTGGPDAYHGHEYLMWYIHCIFHIVVIFAALILIARYVCKLRRPAMAAAIGAIVLGLAGRFLLPALFVPNFASSEIAGMSFFGHSPTTHLATFGLAALCGFLKGRWKLATLALTLAYAAISAPVFGVTDSLSIAVVAGVLALAPHLKLPRFATGPVYVVAGASFFIYLLQFKFLAVVTHFGGAPWLAFPLAIAGGVGVWRAWNWGSQRFGGLWSALRQRPLGFWRIGEARA